MKALPALLGASLLLSSCLKTTTYDPDPTGTGGAGAGTGGGTGGGTGTGTCRVEKEYIYAFGPAIDSATYVYSGDRITGYESRDFRAEVRYSATQMTGRTFYFPAPNNTLAYRSDTFIYNTDGSFARRDVFDHQGGFYRSDSLVFAYNGGKLATLTRYKRDSDGMPMELLRKDTYTYTGNNITGRLQVGYFNGAQSSSVQYTNTYDAAVNYYRKQGLNFFLNDIGRADDPDNMFDYSDYIPDNNLINKTGAGFPIVYGYTADARGNLTVVSVLGAPSTGYTYRCQ